MPDTFTAQLQLQRSRASIMMPSPRMLLSPAPSTDAFCAAGKIGKGGRSPLPKNFLAPVLLIPPPSTLSLCLIPEQERVFHAQSNPPPHIASAPQMGMYLTGTGDQACGAPTGAVPVALLHRYRDRHAVLSVHGRALGSGGTPPLRAVFSPRDSGYLSTHYNHREGDQR